MESSRKVHDYVCHRIRTLRERQGWSATSFAKALKLPRTSYVSMENGAYNMKLEYVQRALETLQADISEVWPPPVGYDARKPGQTDRSTELERFGQMVSATGSDAGLLLHKRRGEFEHLLRYGMPIHLGERMLSQLRETGEFQKGLWFVKTGRKGKYFLYLSAADIDVSLTLLVGTVLRANSAFFDSQLD